MREHFPIIANICSGRITGINFLTFANKQSMNSVCRQAPVLYRVIASSTKCTVDNPLSYIVYGFKQGNNGSNASPLPF